MILTNYLIRTVADDNLRLTDASQERALTRQPPTTFLYSNIFFQHERGVSATIKTLTKIGQHVLCNKAV